MQDVNLIREAYDAVAVSYAQMVSVPGADGGPEKEPDLEMIRKFTGELWAGAKILDAGCGAGRMMTYLDTLTRESQRPWQIQGCDVSGAMLALAREAHPHRSFLAADLAVLPYPAQAFDGLLAWYSIIHTAPGNLGAVFTEFRRLLRPDGVLLLGFQTGGGDRTITNAYGQGVQMTAYLHTVPEVLTTLHQCGFGELASLDRSPEATERYGQGFVLAGAPRG